LVAIASPSEKFIMNKIPDDRTMNELLSMGKDLEDQARKIYEMSIAFAQKYEQRLENQPKQKGSSISSGQEILTDSDFNK
jgi:hypothetical protein